jgi:hypothetical protein
MFDKSSPDRHQSDAERLSWASIAEVACDRHQPQRLLSAAAVAAVSKQRSWP